MKTLAYIGFIVSVLSTGFLHAQATVLGSPGIWIAARTICADNNGNYYTGALQDKIGFLVKKDSLNNVVWSTNYSFPGMPADERVHTTSLKIVGDTLFGCGYIAFSNQDRGGFYFKANATTGNFYWTKFDRTSEGYLSAMRYENGRYFIVGGFNSTNPVFRGKIFAVSSQTGDLIWETKSIRYEYPMANLEFRTNFSDATEMVNGKMFVIGTAVSHGGGPFNQGKPILIGIDFNGNIFLDKYFQYAESTFDEGQTIRYDGNKLLLTFDRSTIFGQNSGWTPTIPYSVVMKCDLLGNVEYAKAYQFEPFNKEAYIYSVNVTPSGYVFYGNNWDNGTAVVFETSKTGVLQIHKEFVSRPNSYTIDDYTFSPIMGTNDYVNNKHYFASTMEIVGNGFIVEQLILDDELNVVDGCTESLIPIMKTTDFNVSVLDGTIIEADHSMNFQNGVISTTPPPFAVCQGITLETSQSSDCSETTVVATIAGFTNPVFIWSNGATGDTVVVQTSDTLIVTVKDAFCCQLVDTIVPIVSNDSLSLSLPSDTLICPAGGGSFVIVSTVSNTLPVTYVWDNGTTGASRTVAQTGTYWLEITDSCRTARDSIHVEFGQLPMIDPIPAVSVCEDDFPVNLTVTTTNATSFSWNNGNTSNTQQVMGAGSFTVNAMNACGRDSLTINVTELPLPQVTLSSSVDTCLTTGSSLKLVPILTNVTSVSWSNGSTLDELNVTRTGNYQVTGFNSCGSDIAQTMITIGQFPELNLPTVLDTCFMEEVGFNYTALGTEGSYSWSSGSQTATELIKHQGTYTVTLTNVCGAVSKSMTVNLVPDSQLELPRDSAIYCGDEVKVSGINLGLNTTYTWHNSDGEPQGEMINENGWYTVQTSDLCGIQRDSIYIGLKNVAYFYLPNTFTPDGDNYNQTYNWKGENVNVHRFTIFNRWGELVFSGVDAIGWDGRWDGIQCIDGTYTVVAVIENCLGEMEEVRASITLLR